VDLLFAQCVIHPLVFSQRKYIAAPGAIFIHPFFWFVLFDISDSAIFIPAMQNFHKYLAITAQEEAWGFYLTTVGYSRTDSNEEYPHNKEHPLTHSFTWNKGRILNGYYLVFISKGRGMFESALSEPAVVTEGTCFFLFPGVWHRYKPDPESGWIEYWIGFKGRYPDELMNNSFFRAESPIVNLGLDETILSLVSGIIDKVKAGKAGYHQVISGIALQILGQIVALTAHKDQDTDEDEHAIAKAKFYLKEHLEESLDMKKLVKELAISYSKFRKLFKQMTGQSPNQYHMNLRLDKAKELLSTTNLNITEVAYQLGFDSVFYFSKLFKKKNKVSPKVYRAK
jgi:AraC-like DNA-binding protein